MAIPTRSFQALFLDALVCPLDLMQVLYAIASTLSILSLEARSNILLGHDTNKLTPWNYQVQLSNGFPIEDFERPFLITLVQGSGPPARCLDLTFLIVAQSLSCQCEDIVCTCKPTLYWPSLSLANDPGDPLPQNARPVTRIHQGKKRSRF
jgi:hypothetical protein